MGNQTSYSWSCHAHKHSLKQSGATSNARLPAKVSASTKEGSDAIQERQEARKAVSTLMQAMILITSLLVLAFTTTQPTSRLALFRQASPESISQSHWGQHKDNMCAIYGTVASHNTTVAKHQLTKDGGHGCRVQHIPWQTPDVHIQL
jgi:hypothetical protein